MNRATITCLGKELNTADPEYERARYVEQRVRDALESTFSRTVLRSIRFLRWRITFKFTYRMPLHRDTVILITIIDMFESDVYVICPCHQL